METRPFKRLKRWLRYLALRLIQFKVSLLPLRFALAGGAVLGRLAFALARRERAKALASLGVAFPELGRADRVALARRCFAHLGACAAELCCLRQIDPILERYVEIGPADQAVLDGAIAGGKGVILVTGHFGNWELLGRRLARTGPPLLAIAKETTDPQTTALVERVRSSGRIRTLWRGQGGAGREMRRGLQDGAILVILIDQDTKVRGLFVDFFGVPAHTPRAAADFALSTGAALVTGFIFRRPDGGHRLALARHEVRPSGDPEADSLAITRTLSAAIEQAIRAAPETWVWMHQRWKTRPEPPLVPQAAEGAKPGDSLPAP